ncbi:sarcosine oxidase subunit gamma [Yoonia sp. BS5-3]|uniref:Sarcosine oxidase subunit gamma n=1 Tax=Yoonia phaeophyticola TaxID=3137369 RepID=A0ABZ3IET8_9RHOB
MHDLTPTPALGVAPQTIGTVKITENTNVALASVAARNGTAQTCAKILKSMLGQVPDISKAAFHNSEVGFWIGADQWMMGAPMDTHEDLSDRLKSKFGAAASITEQSGGWVVIDVVGKHMPDMCEILCNIPIRKMVAGDVQRTMVHKHSCFVIKHQASYHIRVIGPRSSAGSLYDALITAATSVA